MGDELQRGSGCGGHASLMSSEPEPTPSVDGEQTIYHTNEDVEGGEHVSGASLCGVVILLWCFLSF